MNKQKALNMLGLAMRAGKLITGEGLTIDEIRKQRVKLVLVAKDASDNTRKKIQDNRSYYNVSCDSQLTNLEISQAIGKDRMIVGVMDQGFAKRMKELLTE